MIELDGGQHAQAAEADRARTDALAAAGYLVLRFWNDEALPNIDGVLTAIVEALEARSGGDVVTKRQPLGPSPSAPKARHASRGAKPSPSGRGEVGDRALTA